MKKILLLATIGLFQTAYAQKKVSFKNLDSEHKIEVKIGEKIFTNYYYPGKDVLKKAVLNPVFTPQGTEVTRGWPISPRKNERIDHPHHVGVWLNYEDANGHDFWNNSVEVEKSGDKRTFGTIVHTGIKTQKGGKKSGKLVVTADWLDKNGQLMLIEETTYIFSGKDETNIVDRITKLTAADKKVVFKDVKDGFFAIRVARELEIPSNKPEMFTDASGLATKVPVLDNTGVNGNYLNAQGITGEDTWSKRSEWVTLQGNIGQESISVSIFDHPKNVNYPSYWHTRGYGLFSVNPLGEKVFTNGKKETNLTLEPGQSTTFRYRLAVSSAKLSPEKIQILATDFNKRY
ncbi:MAG: PmoA family protein [Cytophagaceae bacterium]|nr:PmoA family protein [Cytophagaceae bacterium]MBL0301331.1 PmoA family protein [Cytophagaceae bacterium]MBL0324150.1 PmoA family protein [Cytophagaceae bacterium]